MAEREEQQNPGTLGDGASAQSPKPKPASASDASDAPDADAALQGVESAVEALQHEAEDAAHAASAMGAALHFPEITNGSARAGDDLGLSLLSDVSLRVKIELGRTRMFVEDVLHLNEHSVVELDKAAGDPVDIYVNDRHVARGEVLVVNENFCVRVSEIIKQPALEEIEGG